MELRLGQIQRQTIEQKQALKAKQSQRQELALRLNLRLESPPPFEAVKGLEGVILADKILKEKKEVGILIGGLARKLWERTKNEKDFEKKDVDVLVLPNENKKCSINYGNGIDWWLPESKKISFEKEGVSIKDMEFNYFKNLNNVILYFNATVKEKMKHGLHLLDLQQLIDMLYTESSSVVRDSVQSGEVLEKYEANLKRSYQKVPSKHMPDEFKSNFVPFIEFELIDPFARNTLEKIK